MLYLSGVYECPVKQRHNLKEHISLKYKKYIDNDQAIRMAATQSGRALRAKLEALEERYAFGEVNAKYLTGLAIN